MSNETVTEDSFVEAFTGTTEVTETETSVDWSTAKESWQNASERVDDQLSKLQEAMREIGSEELTEIADYGLNGITENNKVPLLASIQNIDRASGDERKTEAKKALEVIASFKSHIETDERITVCEENPLGVTVTIKALIGSALSTMEKSVKVLAA